VRVTGEVGGDALDLTADDAWASVGTKNDGRPSDLELYFAVDGTFYVLRFDDLGLETGPGELDAARRRVELDTTKRKLDLVTGRITIESFALDGAFSVAAEVAPGEAEPKVVITAEGRFR